MGAGAEVRRVGVVLVDFDGTVTPVDADFALADALLGSEAGPAMYGPLAAAYERLEIDMQTYFAGYLAGLNATPAQMAAAAAGLPVRPGFGAFVSWCQEVGLEVRLVSEGLQGYIQPMLEAHGWAHLPLSCNRAELNEGRYRIIAAAGAETCGRCLNCKGAHVRRARAQGAQFVAIVGNGASDLCAAKVADLVLARDGLSRHCERLGIGYVGWRTFADVRAALSASRRRR